MMVIESVREVISAEADAIVAAAEVTAAAVGHSGFERHYDECEWPLEFAVRKASGVAAVFTKPQAAWLEPGVTQVGDRLICLRCYCRWLYSKNEGWRVIE